MRALEKSQLEALTAFVLEEEEVDAKSFTAVERQSRLITGPYGTLMNVWGDNGVLDPLSGEQIQVPGLSNPAHLLGALPVVPEDLQEKYQLIATREYIRAIVKYLFAGVGISTLNGFSLNKIDDLQLYEDLLKTMVSIHRSVFEALDVEDVQLWLPLGPRGDCYVYDDGKRTLRDKEGAVAFWNQRLKIAQGLGLDRVMAETVPNDNSMEGFFQAAKEQGFEATGCFYIDTEGNLLNGQKVVDVFTRIDLAVKGVKGGIAASCCSLPGFERLVSSFASLDLKNFFLGGHVNSTDVLPHEVLGAADETSDVIKASDMQARAMRIGQILNSNPHFCHCGFCCGTDHQDAKNVAFALRTFLAA